MIRCGFCGHEFQDEEGIRGCGKCGKPGGCSMVRCPKCFYENPPEPALVKKIKGMFKK
jgi:predicted amidophosphoribosyltransferase